MYERKIHELALTRAATFKKAHAELLETVMAVDQTQLYQKFLLTSTFAYCQTILRLSEDVTCTLTKLARASQKVPELKVAIDEGSISISNARQIATVVTQENKFEWLEKAKALSQKKLQHEIAKTFPSEAILEKVKYVSERRMKLEMGLSEEVMTLFKRAQDLISQKTRKAASLEETLHAILADYIEREDPIEKAKRAEQRKLKSPVARRGATQKITLKPHRTPIPADVRHQVNLRDSHRCQARLPNGNICGSQRWLDHHHIHPVAEGGANTLENLLTLCAHHHHQYHKT